MSITFGDINYKQKRRFIPRFTSFISSDRFVLMRMLKLWHLSDFFWNNKLPKSKMGIRSDTRQTKKTMDFLEILNPKRFFHISWTAFFK